MAFRIDDPETEKLAIEVAEKMGLPVEDAILVALKERKERLLAQGVAEP